ncbi:hypothetical protein A2U01_0038331, partial [Trifolium medium]|nr:hypothetical protein [Trifolium medium]
ETTCISPALELEPKVITPIPRSNDLGGSYSGLGQELAQIRSVRPKSLLPGSSNYCPARTHQHSISHMCSSCKGCVFFKAYPLPRYVEQLTKMRAVRP